MCEMHDVAIQCDLLPCQIGNSFDDKVRDNEDDEAVVNCVMVI